MAASWYADPELVPTTVSASYVCNNLSKHGDSLVYAHVDDAVHVNTSQTPHVITRLPCAEKSFVHQVRFCTLAGVVVIVVASENGVQIYDAAGQQCYYELGIKDTVEGAEPVDLAYCQGICSVNSSQPRIAVGNSLGRLLLIGQEGGSKAAETPEFDLVETLRDHTEAICCLESSASGEFVASGDASGTILVRRTEDKFDIAHRLPGDGFPATSLVFLSDHRLVAGYITGTLRIFNPDNFRVVAEVAAHSRAITALDTRGPYVVSVSEDTFLNVWEIAEGSKGPSIRVKLASSLSVPNDLLVGVAFASEKNVYTATYDCASLKLWVPE